MVWPAAAAISASAAAMDAAGRNNRSTIGSISAAQAVQSIQEPVPRAQPGSLLTSVPLPVEALERPRGGIPPAAAVPHTSPPPMLSTMTPRPVPPPQPVPLATPAMTLQVKQEADCAGECEEIMQYSATACKVQHEEEGESRMLEQP